MTRKIYTLTFDTSVKIDAFDVLTEYQSNSEMFRRVSAAQKLKDAHNQGIIEIFYNGGEKSNEVNEQNTFKEVRGPWIIGFDGFSEAGVSTYLVSGDFAKLVQEILGKPNVLRRSGQHAMRDYALLVEHVSSGRDIFVSADKKKHTNHAAKFARHGIIVKSAEETIDYLETQGVL